jgi:hypothetical protein
MSESVKMNPEIKAQWLEALRSGKFEQARGLLHVRDDGYCCLGVLAEVMGCTWQPIEGKSALYPFLDGVLEAQQNNTEIDNYLNDDLLAKAGLTKAQQIELAQMNDKDKTFAEIANYIEDNM